MDKIIVLDFGGQTTQLISRRVRDIGVYCEVLPGDRKPTPDELKDVKGLIFSGSPYSVYEEECPVPPSWFYEQDLPLLGICYGFQRMTYDNGGKVEQSAKREFGREPVSILQDSPLLKGIPDGFFSWMSHGDSILELAPGFVELARSDAHPAAAYDPNKNLWALQFHPESSHCDYGALILENFVCGIAGAEKSWSVEQYIDQSLNRIQKQVGDSKVLLFISGGVDSTVTAALLLKALPPENVHLMYIDTGMMRKGETEEVSQNLKQLGATHLHIVDASQQFLEGLKGVEAPEEKRHIIGDTFIHLQEEAMIKLDIKGAFLAQGTLYTDLIESGKGVGNKAKVIKSHHNVASPLVAKMREDGHLIEPLDQLYKDEVRNLGRKLGVSEVIISRHPFPGPGLGVRILGEVTPEKCRILREADGIMIEELRKRELYHDIWQAFCALLPVRSTGVRGDARGYGYVLAMRCVNSLDGMTADVYPFPMDALLAISNRITNHVPEISRVVYDVSSKPPATIEWE